MKEIAAGGVVYAVIDGQLHIQLIRDRYGKVTLAKGKQEAGETIEQTALREIHEETGVQGEMGSLIEKISYTYISASGNVIDKEVYYFLVKALHTDLQTQEEEISDVAWYRAQEAVELHAASGYANNEIVIQKALRMLER
jgi:8-oxo-dGTP pyrophosphatase MutT (NUDIX family)